jgi:transposase
MEALGHEVQLIAPQYVRPFVKRQKNDAAYAEALVIAARQPEMRFVEPKTVDVNGRSKIPRMWSAPLELDHSISEFPQSGLQGERSHDQEKTPSS